MTRHFNAGFQKCLKKHIWQKCGPTDEAGIFLGMSTQPGLSFTSYLRSFCNAQRPQLTAHREQSTPHKLSTREKNSAILPWVGNVVVEFGLVGPHEICYGQPCCGWHSWHSSAAWRTASEEGRCLHHTTEVPIARISASVYWLSKDANLDTRWIHCCPPTF